VLDFDHPLPARSLRGRAAYQPGVNGQALLFDGFTTTAVVPRAALSSFDRGLSVEAWIAPQEYSWNWTAIVNQGADRSSGFYLGMDYVGRIGFTAAVNGTPVTAVSTERVPLLRWTHVAASLDTAFGVRLFINGREAASTPGQGKYTAATADVWVGANHALMGVANTEREPSRKALAGTRMVFDGLIDELKIHDLPAVPRNLLTVANPQPLQYRVLPSGPKGAVRFGAYYEALKYSDSWDALWRTSGPDVVVAFDFAPVRLVSWRGISYNPCWVTENGAWFSNEFMERSVAAGCAESMSDKQTRYSSVKILESNDARAVVYWRYSPVDINYEIPFADPVTGWGDWAEEIYTVYPDGVAVRKFTGYTSVPRSKSFWEWAQSLPILHPGQRPEDVLNASPFVSLANMKGRSQDYRWPPSPADPALPDANIQVVNYRSRFKPFLILTDRKPRIWLPRYEKRAPGDNIEGMSMPSGSDFWWWNHWPVAMLPSDGRVAPAADRPSHSWAANQDSEPWETTAGSETQLMLCGLTDKTAAALTPLARSWMRAPELDLHSPAFTSRGFDPAQRSFLLRKNSPSDLQLTLQASSARPIVNPSFVIESWGEHEPRLEVNGKPLHRGPAFRYGFNRKLDRTDLVVWLQLDSIAPVSITMKSADR
jgi:hypothetical protein